MDWGAFGVSSVSEVSIDVGSTELAESWFDLLPETAGNSVSGEIMCDSGEIDVLSDAFWKDNIVELNDQLVNKFIEKIKTNII